MAEISQIKKIVFQLRRATTEEWKSNENCIPHEGEPCYDLDLCTLKIGDGKTPYKDLKGIGATPISDDGLFLIVENLQSDVDELRSLVGDASIEAKIDEALENIIDNAELQDVLDSILN
jgi:hypothetical protein